MSVPAVTPEETAAARMVLARAEKRLAPMIARRGAADELVLATAARYEREYERATRPVVVVDDDLLAMVHAVADPPEVPQLVVLPRVIGGGR
jgi:hypothetical protein